MLNRGSPEGASSHHADWSYVRRHAALLILCLVAVFNLIDRQVMTILLEPIKQEFGASDMAMGLLTGSVFALFYVATSIPLARLADKIPRRVVISASLGAWSLMTMLGGMAGSMVQLAVTRMGVAIGEGGSGPASLSLIADLYPLKHRAKAVALYVAATSIGMGLAVILGGWLAQHYGWRATLVAVGVPGVLLALLVRFGLGEPARGMSDTLSKANANDSYDFGEVLRYLWQLRSYRYIVLTVGIGAATGYGTLIWGPTFIMRTHGLSSTVAGAVFGSMSIFASLVAEMLAGVVADFAGRRDLRAYLWIPAAGCALGIPCGLLFALAQDWRFAVLGFGLLSFFTVPNFMCCTVAVQTLVPPRMRAVAAVILLLATTIFGLGLAPLFIGAANDAMKPYFGHEAIRFSLVLNLISLLFCVVTALMAARYVRSDYARLRGEERDASLREAALVAGTQREAAADVGGM